MDCPRLPLHPGELDQLQLTYRPGTGVNDAVIYLLHRHHQASVAQKKDGGRGGGPAASGLDNRLPHQHLR